MSYPAITIFALTYFFMAGLRVPGVGIDRHGAALCGAIAMVACTAMTQEQAYAAVRWDVICLLLGMMVIGAYLTHAQFFRYFAWWLLGRAKTARRLLWYLIFVVGISSALLVNDTICLIMTPLVVALVTEANLPALPYLLALAGASNVGGVVTFTGNPQNMMIGAHAADLLSFRAYTLIMLPTGMVCLVTLGLVLVWLFGRQLPRGKLHSQLPPKPYLDKKLAAIGLLALVTFLALALLHVDLAAAALLCAAGTILLVQKPAKSFLEKVDWSLILFFAGLFVVVHGVAAAGVLQTLEAHLQPLWTNPTWYTTWLLVLVIVVMCNVISNVPFVMVAVAWPLKMADPTWGYVLLAFAATLAGNLTMFGSIANVIVFEGAGPRGKIGFGKFLFFGSIVTLTTLFAGGATLYCTYHWFR